MDRDKVQDLFSKINAGVQVKEEVRFCKRLGVKKDNKDRPLLIGLKTKHARSKVLYKAPTLAKESEPWSKVNVVADMTQRQRKEDSEAKEEAEKKNSEMNDEDSKNWIWKVVGARGQKRVVKTRVLEEGEERDSQVQKKRKLSKN